MYFLVKNPAPPRLQPFQRALLKHQVKYKPKSCCQKDQTTNTPYFSNERKLTKNAFIIKHILVTEIMPLTSICRFV